MRDCLGSLLSIVSPFQGRNSVVYGSLNHWKLVLFHHWLYLLLLASQGRAAHVKHVGALKNLSVLLLYRVRALRLPEHLPGGLVGDV